jgi:porin
MARRVPLLSAILILAASLSLAHEFEVPGGEITVGGVVSGAAQCGESSCLAAVPLQPEVSVRLPGDHELRFKFGFASGDGQTASSPFNISPWAADLEGDVANVNGRERSYLLTAWYRYTATLGDDATLGATVGIIDATDYLDENAYSNDEYTQFMNSALVNGPNVFLPSYDLGVALDWTGRHWSVRGVYMNVGENDDGNAFDFVGMQVGYRADTPLGEGNYRLVVDGTDRRFHDPTGTSLENRAAILVSCDQQLGGTLGAFVRLGRQDDAAAIDYGAIYSGGIDLAGGAWSREGDNIGIGYAYLTGGNGDIRRSQVVETYYRVALGRSLALTGDLQYMRDDYVAGEGSEALEGAILGLRLSAEF